ARKCYGLPSPTEIRRNPPFFKESLKKARQKSPWIKVHWKRRQWTKERTESHAATRCEIVTVCLMRREPCSAPAGRKQVSKLSRERPVSVSAPFTAIFPRA